MYKKGVTVMKLRKLLSFVCCLIFIFTFAVSNVYAAASTDEKVIDNYLTEAGFPDDIIKMMPADLKKSVFERKEIYENSNTTYGILTDEYAVEYTLDKNNNIVIDNENIEELNKFLSDESAVKRVESDNLKAAELPVLSLREELLKKTHSDVLSEETRKRLILRTNWKATLGVNHVKVEDGRVTKRFVYWWAWSHNPVYKLVDQVVVSWSDSFTLHMESVHWTYIISSYEDSGTVSGTGCDTYHEDKGMAQSIDILYGFFNENGAYIDRIVGHGGVVYGDIERDIKDDSISSISARYFHQIIKWDPTFTFGDDGIQIHPEVCYDKSPDSGVDFYY